MPQIYLYCGPFSPRCVQAGARHLARVAPVLARCEMALCLVLRYMPSVADTPVDAVLVAELDVVGFVADWSA